MVGTSAKYENETEKMNSKLKNDRRVAKTIPRTAFLSNGAQSYSSRLFCKAFRPAFSLAFDHCGDDFETLA